jgi:hypothetical protein
MYDLCMFIRYLVSMTQVLKILNLGYIIGVSVEIYLLFINWQHTNPHWTRVVGYGLFSLCVIHKEGLCPSSGDINSLMMMMIWQQGTVILMLLSFSLDQKRRI